MPHNAMLKAAQGCAGGARAAGAETGLGGEVPARPARRHAAAGHAAQGGAGRARAAAACRVDIV